MTLEVDLSNKFLNWRVKSAEAEKLLVGFQTCGRAASKLMPTLVAGARRLELRGEGEEEEA